MQHSSFLCRLLVVVLLASLSPLARADNWPQWRGPQNNGHSKETGLPTTWSETKNIAWKLELPGFGSSTPAVWGDRLFLTSVEKKELILLCVSTEGKVVWRRVIGPAVQGSSRQGEGNNEAGSSPSTDGKHVYAYGGTGDFACFDFDGNEVWKFNAQKRYGRFEIGHGMHITPLLHENRLYLALLTNGGHWVIALDKATGKDIWKVERKSDAEGESREAYTSPVLWRNGKELNLVVLGCDYATGHRLSDGAEVFRVADINVKAVTSHRIITSPVASDDLLVVPTCRGLIVIGIKPGAKGFIKTGSEFEQFRISKGSPDVSSPLIDGGLVYLQQDSVLLCIDAKTGNTQYNERLTAGRYRGSPVLADGKIYTVGRDSGTVSVVKTGSKFELLSNNRLNDVFPSSPAISQGRIYLRGFQTLYAISEGGK